MRDTNDWHDRNSINLSTNYNYFNISYRACILRVFIVTVALVSRNKHPSDSTVGLGNYKKWCCQIRFMQEVIFYRPEWIWQEGSERDLWNVDFQGHLYENHVHRLKVLKKLYKGHLNGTYRFLIRNSEKCRSKLSKLVKFRSKHVVSRVWATISTISDEKSIYSV